MKWVKVLQLQWHKIVSFIGSLWAHRCKQTDLRSVITSNSNTTSSSICSSRNLKWTSHKFQTLHQLTSSLCSGISFILPQLQCTQTGNQFGWERETPHRAASRQPAQLGWVTWRSRSSWPHRLKANSVFSGMGECLSDTRHITHYDQLTS